MIGHRLVEVDIDDAAGKDLAKTLLSVGEEEHELSIVEQTDESTTIKIVEVESSAASHVTIPTGVFASPVYANLRRSYARLVEIVGMPPFRLELGKKERAAETFEGLRHEALDLAKEGINVGRFKGLGEMNPEELWATTMDPAKRMLVKVEVEEDAAAADRMFSMLMGDQVEPRREFMSEPRSRWSRGANRTRKTCGSSTSDGEGDLDVVG